jgi:hypothetical protein
MKIFPFDENLSNNTFTLFPEEIENDPWVMYHGTSSFNQESIELDGFAFGAGFVSRDEIQKVVDIYDKMKWCGLNGSSLAVLKPFSLMHDFGDSESSPVYFAETSKRAVLYASRDFAGGEKMRALRHSIHQLQRYLDEPEVRQAHWKNMKSEYDFLVNNNGLNPEASRPVDVDLTWLSSQLSLLSDLRDLTFGTLECHSFGVVYAVKIDASDLDALELHNTMGIKSSGRIAPSKIVGKVAVPRDYIHHSAERCSEELEKLWAFTTGIYAILSQRKATD